MKEILLEALQQIATGEIVGESKNYKDSLYIVKQIAKEAIEDYTSKIIPQEEPKQETLEEAAERYESTFEEFSQGTESIDFIAGAKWQAERMYSEEDCYNTIHNLMTDIKLNGLVINDDIDLKKWFQKYKNK